MKKTVDVEIDISPEDAVMAFSDGGDDWQARFFNMLAEDVEHGYANGAAGFAMQMQYVANTGELTPGARWIMAIIGEYASDEVAA